MATLAELRELYPSVYQGKSDFAAVKLLADARQASLPLVAYELGLNPEDYYQNESNSQDFGTDLAIGGAEAVRGVAGIANIAAAPFTDEQLITTPGLDEYIQRQQATMSPNRQRAQGELDQAWEDGGFWNILGEYASEPAYLTGMGLQSAPAMVGGGVGGMALRGAARLGAGALARGLGAAAPYIGEGAIAGGMDYAQMVEQGVDPQVAAGYGALAGAGVGALGGVGGAFANRMGITDVSRALSGARRVDGDVPLSYGRQLGYGSLNEAGQEILQSPWEQAMQNLATDQPVTEGLARSAVEGGILGGVMGAGFNAMPRGRGRELDLTQDRDNTQGLVNPAQPFAGVPGGNTTPESPQARRQADLEAAFGAADQNLGLSSGHFDANLGRELTLGELPSEVYDPKLGRNLTHAELITNPDYQGTVAKPTAPKAAAAPKASPPENPTLAALRQRYADNPTWPTKGLLSTKGAVLPGFAKTRLPALQVIIGQNTPEEAIKRLRVEQDAVNQKKGDLAPHVSRLIDVLIAEQEAKLASQGQTTSAKADTAGTVPEGNGLAPQAKTTSVMPAQETPAPAAPQDDLGEFPPYPGPAAETGTSLADLAARNQPKPKAATAEKDLTKDAAPTGTEGLIADAAQAEALPTTQAPKQTNQKLVIDDADADHQARFDATLDQVATKRNIPPPARAVLADLMQRYFRIGKYHEYSGVQPPSYTSMAAALNDSGYAVSHTTAGILAKEFQDLYAAELERQGKPVEYFDPQAMAWTGTLDDGNQRGTRSLDATAEEFNAEQGYGRDELVDAEQGVDGLGDVSSEADAVLATGTDDLGQFGNARSGDATLNAIGEADATANDPQDDADIDEELGYQLGGIGSKADAAAGGIGGADAVSARPRVVKFYADRHLFAANKYREARGEPPLTPKQAKAELSKLSDVALGRHLDRLTKAGISGKRLADVNDPKPKLVDAYAALQDDLAALGTGALRGEKSGRTVVELETPDTSVAVSGAVGAWQQATRSIPNAPALDTLSPELFTLWEKAHNGALELPDFHREAWLRNFARDLINERDTQSKRGVVAGTAAQPQASDAAGTAPRPTDAENLSESGSAQPELATGGREVEAPAGVGTVVSENRNTSAAKDAADRAAKIAARKAAAKAAQGAAANLSRQGGTARSGQTVAAVEGWIAQAKAKLAPWVQNGIQVVQSVDDLRAALPNQGIPDDAVGAHSNGKVYLVADQIGSSRQALRTLAHEVVGHLGLERLLGNDFADLVDKVARHLQANVKVVADVAAEVKRRYGDLSPTEQTKEIMALLAERQPNFGLVREVLAKLRVWLAKHGLGSLEAAELNQLLVNAARTVRGKGATSAGASPTAPTLARTGDTRTRYEARIDELFAGAPAARVGAKVLDRSDMLDMLGYGGKPVVLREAKVLLSEDNHAAMTAAQWKKIPEWIDNPVAVFDSDTVAGRLVLVAPEAINGAPVFIIMEPNARENTLDTHLLVNAYDATGGRTPVSRWLKDGKLRYINNEKSPALSDTSWLQLPRVYRQIPGSKVKILTERNLVKYREANPLPGQDTVNFQRGTDDTLPAFKTAQGWLKQEFKSGKAVGEGRGLGWLTMAQIAERYGDQVPALRAINTAIGTMEAQAEKWVGKAEHIDRLWQQLSKAQDKRVS
ncbi:MAG: hypothetical protein KA125_03030, partial [Chromatiaceae bacterium]|nr:hypothetical protein [Chromatiaceae bacterium]